MSKEKLKQIFIEEATEIIEKMDIDILNFEESPSDKGLLNEIFRGVHTLKGSANAFNFSRLGEFVHHFEDVLDFFRSSDVAPNASHVDVFLEGVTVIKETLVYEVEDQSGTPDGYEACLEKIRNIILHVKSQEEPKSVTCNDLALEFGNDDFEMTPQKKENEEEFFSALQEDEKLFKITLKLDTDIYLRGFDHFLFFKNLLHVGRILSSFWQIPQCDDLESFNAENNEIKEVTVYLASLKMVEDIADVFAFLETEEFEVMLVSPPQKEVEVFKNEEKVEVKEEIKEEKSKTVVAQKSFLKIDSQKLDELFDSIGELVIAQNYLGENSKIKAVKDAEVTKTIENLSKITKLIQNRVMGLRMIPIRDTFEKMKRVARDSSKKVNKPIHLVLEGEDTEIDKTMVEALSDPLIHIIRNSIDHGIESTPADRLKAGKEEEGVVTLSAYHKGGNIIIEVRDDGRGINKQKVYQKALERGIINASDELSDAQVYGLIMQPGFSTADTISDLSGRGVGLDVVRNAIEGVRGKIDIVSAEGKGSTFSIVLPLTLAIIDGMIVRCSDKIYIIPTLSIIESFRPQQESVHIAGGKEEFVQLRSELLPIIRLARALELEHTSPNPWESTLVCIENDKGKFALLVDELVGRQQVVIKTLGEFFAKTEGVSGGAVMGNGEVALILNVEELY
ncbi:chemotaxis protein CheA [Sulfurospirillum diekertiae]|uniref:Chemotaxis protein CheA n=1 Tax=Sulfurospirillum diekertiae TaxID=1854492 RepID=A0A1Y0HNN3_9BACT|nr:chemotaxis protein CheA [Sulfurospirillum diekertiae]ARU49701.1 Chemotaxis protein CheA [Sulfurospirillum diekertiae]ASC94498.1 Chemotaxis protein CheA [Sulfurospirillum diekertiae]